MSVRSERLEGQFGTLRVAEKLSRMESREARVTYIRYAVSRIESRVDRLRAAERRALRRHSRGEITTDDLLVRLARIDASADQLGGNLSVVESRADEIEGFSIEGRIDVVRLQLRTLRGPVRSHVADAVAGETEPTRVFVQTARDGVVLATVADGRYVREVVDGSRFSPNPTEKIDAGELDRILRRSYPTVLNLSGGYRTAPSQRQESDFFVATVPYPSGNLTAFVDRKVGAADVFREEQSYALNSTPATEPLNATVPGMRLTVYPSYPGGPMLVRVTDPDTGDPLRANVSFVVRGSGGEYAHVGWTNERGELWTVAPNETVSVVAVSPTDRTVDRLVAPVEPRRVRNATDDGGGGNGSETA